MHWLYYALMILVDLGGLVLAAFTLPGLWLMLGAAAVYSLLTHGFYLGVMSLVVLLLLAGGSEIAEFTLGGAGAKKAGATRWGIGGALVGGILGGIFLTAFIPIPVIGTIVGICLGSFLGAFGIEMVMGQTVPTSARIGLGAAKGRLFGIMSKVIVGLVMIAIAIFAGFPYPHRSPAPAAKIPRLVRPATQTAQN